MLQPYYDRDGIAIYHGDALSVLSALPAESVDAIVCDPPYSSGGLFRGDRTASTRAKYVQSEAATRTKLPEFSGDTRDQRSYGFWCGLWLAQAYAIAKPGGTCAAFTDWRQLPVTTDALQAGGWLWRGIFVWDKTAAARPSGMGFTNQCEYVVWGTKGKSGRAGKLVLPGVVQHRPLYEGRDEKHHVAAKPLPVMETLLRIVPEGGVVLDPFMGSGSTLVAAKALGLRAIGIEVEERYCEVAARRLDEAALAAVA